MRVGGRVEWLLEPADPEELRRAWVAVRERGRVPRLLGGGANLIVDDGDLPWTVISTGRMQRLFRPARGTDSGRELDDRALPPQVPLERGEDPRLVAWAGTTLPRLVSAAQRLGLTGLEGLVGVPGCVGGGIAMNAGGRWGELWDVIELVRVLTPDGELRDLPREACRPAYRDGGLGSAVAVGAVFRLEPERAEVVRERMREYLTEKSRAQPVTERSAGCIFRNPDRERSAGRSAGLLIEESGAKSLTRGDAIVSPKHGNFIVNRGAARAADVFALIEDVRARVAHRTGIELRTEVRTWRAGPDPNGEAGAAPQGSSFPVV